MAFIQFRQFLIVKLYDRVQEMSREKCSGCHFKYRFDILHPCITTPLDVRIYKFFTQAVTEVLGNLGTLLAAYEEMYMLLEEPSAYLTEAKSFIQAIHPDQLVDRKYINEDTGPAFPFDSSWLTQPTDSPNPSQTPERPDSPKIPKIKKKNQKAVTQPTQSKPFEAIVDTPKRQRITKKRKSIHKVPCDDPACCKDQ